MTKKGQVDREERKRIVDSASPEDPLWLGYDWYTTDGTQVINNEASTCVLDGADPLSFRVFPRPKLRGFSMRRAGQYAQDDNRVYFDRELIAGVDADSFKRLGTAGYAHDAKQLLFMGQRLALQPTKPFRVMGLVLVAANAVYLAGQVLDGIDSSTFEVVDKLGRFRDHGGEYQLEVPNQAAGWNRAQLTLVEAL